MKRKVAYGRIVFGVTGLIVGCIVFWRISYGSVEAIRTLVTVFSILAGMLIAILTMLGNPESIFPGNWRIASVHRRELKRLLRRYTWLIYIYLIVIAMAFAGSLDTEFSGSKIMKRLALALGSAALVWSFALPNVIYRAQINRLDEEVNQRRNPKSDKD